MLGRCRRRVLLCAKAGARNRRSRALHGYLTRDGIAPDSFNKRGRAELVKYGVRFRSIGVTAVTRRANRFQVSFAKGADQATRFVLIATGVTDHLPAIPGFNECYGRSVFHCPYCDGWEWRDRPLAVLGRGGDGARLALGLKAWSTDVLLCAGLSDEALLEGHLARNRIAIRTERILGLDLIEAPCRRYDLRKVIRRGVTRFSSPPHSIFIPTSRSVWAAS